MARAACTAAEERHGLRFLVGAEAVLYDESVHLIEGVATDRVERL